MNQYFLHARMYENWGLKSLGKVTYEESIGEMKHADKLIKRVLFLDGLPNLQDRHKQKIGEAIGECLEADLADDAGGRKSLVGGIKDCEDRPGLCVLRDPHRHPRGHRGAHRLPGNLDRPVAQPGGSELSAVRHGRTRGLTSATQGRAQGFRKDARLSEGQDHARKPRARGCRQPRQQPWTLHPAHPAGRRPDGGRGGDLGPGGQAERPAAGRFRGLFRLRRAGL